tara:strand:- start:11 stop:616 length:606 start_codon:yes stop_codon:yes gene_type:complete
MINKIEIIYLLIYISKQMMNKVKFNYIPDELQIFNKLPYDLHRYIYGFISYDVINSIFYKYNWYEIFEYIGNSYSYEYLIKKINCLLPKLYFYIYEITDSDMYTVGFYEEKVKASIWGRRYIWYEDCINEENTIYLIIEKIDDYITSKHYNEEVLFKINKNISLILKEINKNQEINEEINETDEYFINLSKEMNYIVDFIK